MRAVLLLSTLLLIIGLTTAMGMGGLQPKKVITSTGTLSSSTSEDGGNDISTTTVIERRYQVVIEGDKNIDEEESNRIRKAVEEMVEKNVRSMETNRYNITIEGNLVYVKPNKIEGVPPYVKRAFDEVKRRIGLDINTIGEFRHMERRGTTVTVKILVPGDHVVVGKSVVFDEETNTGDVNIVVYPVGASLVLVEENIPKGTEFNVMGPHVVVNFDPVIAWVVDLRDGNARTIEYTVRGGTPPDLDPMVAELASCNVSVKLLSINSSGGKVSGEFQILLGGAPVYTPDIRAGDSFTFVRRTMSYVFESVRSPVVIEGRVGDCSFYKEIETGHSYMIPAVVVILFIVVAALLLKAKL